MRKPEAIRNYVHYQLLSCQAPQQEGSKFGSSHSQCTLNKELGSTTV